MATRSKRNYPSKITLDYNEFNAQTLQINKMNTSKLDEQPLTPIMIKVNTKLESLFSRYFKKKEIV